MSWYQMILSGGSSPEPGPTPPEPGPTVEIVPFSTGTDAQIAAMLEAYYNDDITWEDMNWSIGETRTIHLPSFALPSPENGVTDAQDIVVTIIDHDHTDLATPINGHTKSCITVQTKELLSSTAGTPIRIYIDGNTEYDINFTKWANLYMRTYLNNTFYNNVNSNNIMSLAKLSKHYRHTDYNTSEAEIVTDIIFLPSYPEVFGTAAFNFYVVTNPVEDTQFAYYANDDTTRRIKYPNNNGQPAPEGDWNYQVWFIGSPSSYHEDATGYTWMAVNYNGYATFGMTAGRQSLAPAWAM